MFLGWWRSQVKNSLHFALDIAPYSLCYKRSQAKHIRVCISSVRTLSDCVRVLRMCTVALQQRDHVTSADLLAEFVCNMFDHHAPTEQELQVLSILQQEAEGTKGVKEYAVNLLWTCALACLLERENELQNKKESFTELGHIPVVRSLPEIHESTLTLVRSNTL